MQLLFVLITYYYYSDGKYYSYNWTAREEADAGFGRVQDGPLHAAQSFRSCAGAPCQFTVPAGTEGGTTGASPLSSVA